MILAGGVAVAIAGFAALRTRAAERCFADGTCEAGIADLHMQTPYQMCEEWCWAASIQTIFLLHGHAIDQRVIVEKLYGSLNCAPASTRQIFAAITGGWIDASGRRFYAEADVLQDSSAGYERDNAFQTIIADLAAGRPLINGALRHATVITAVRYRPSATHPQLISVTVRDPWPANSNKRQLSLLELWGTGFITRVLVRG